jgi:hypothetical protein
MSFRRLLGLDRNPLRRHVDRVQAAVTVSLAAALALAGPVAAAAAGTAAYRAVAPAAAEERATRVLTDATLIQDPLAAHGGDDTTWPVSLVRVDARWTAPDGTPHTGKVTVGRGRQVGDVVRVWVGPDGRTTPRPRTTGNVLATVAGLAAGAVLTLGGLLLLVGLGARRLLDRRRARLWEEEWLAVEPSWCRHR